MKYVKHFNTARNAIEIKNSDYQAVLSIIMKHADTVCFTVLPYLDNIDEVKEDFRYEKIMDSYVDSEFTESIHTEKSKESFIYFKLDYFVREFLKEKKNIFDFYDEDAPVNLEDIVFINKGNIVCDTITHEHYCAVTDDLLEEIQRKHKEFNQNI